MCASSTTRATFLCLMLVLCAGEELWQSWPKRQVTSASGLKLYKLPCVTAAVKAALPRCAAFYFNDLLGHIPSKCPATVTDTNCWIQVYYKSSYGFIRSSSGAKRCGAGGARVALVAYYPATACKPKPKPSPPRPSDPCKGNPCGKSGSCRPTADGKGYTCKCRPNFAQCTVNGKPSGPCTCGSCRRIALGCSGESIDSCKAPNLLYPRKTNCVPESPDFNCCCCATLYG